MGRDRRLLALLAELALLAYLSYGKTGTRKLVSVSVDAGRAELRANVEVRDFARAGLNASPGSTRAARCRYPGTAGR